MNSSVTNNKPKDLFHSLTSLFISTVIGITSGASFSLLISTYTVYLSMNNVSLEILGLLSLRTIPYSLKFLWSPLVDTYHIKLFPLNFGQRKAWMIITQCCLVFSIVAMGYIDIQNHLYLSCLCAFFTAIFAATHDIAMDSFRIEFCKARASPKANSFVVLGFRIGFLISGAIALYLSTIIEWKYVFCFIACCIVPCIVVVYFVKEDRIHQHRKYNTKQDWLKENIIEPLAVLVKLPKFYLILFVVAFYKMSDGYLSALLIPFLLQAGFDRVDISLVTETLGLLSYITGNFIGAYLLQKMRSLLNLFLAELLAAATNLMFIFLIYDHGNMNFYIFATCFESVCAGIANISLINYMSSLCKDERYTSTHYSLLISLSGLSRAIVASSSGILVTTLGWSAFFMISASLSIPSLICLTLLSEDKSHK